MIGMIVCTYGCMFVSHWLDCYGRWYGLHLNCHLCMHEQSFEVLLQQIQQKHTHTHLMVDTSSTQLNRIRHPLIKFIAVYCNSRENISQHPEKWTLLAHFNRNQKRNFRPKFELCIGFFGLGWLFADCGGKRGTRLCAINRRTLRIYFAKQWNHNDYWICCCLFIAVCFHCKNSGDINNMTISTMTTALKTTRE